MSAKYCPSWIFNLSTASTAYEFIISDLPIKAYAKKYANGLNEHYGEIKPEEIESAAENLLRFLLSFCRRNFPHKALRELFLAQLVSYN